MVSILNNWQQSDIIHGLLFRKELMEKYSLGDRVPVNLQKDFEIEFSKINIQ